MAERPVWLIGCGNMAGAMLNGWLAAGEAPERFHVVRPSGAPVLVSVAENIPVSRTLPETGFGNAIVQLGFKPYMLGDMAPHINGLVSRETSIVSILAGVERATLSAVLPQAGYIVRAMPNLPVELGRGVVGLCPVDGEEADPGIPALMEKLGHVERIGNDRQLDIATALSGSGPAFLYRFIDALGQAGTALGLDGDQAQRMAMHTVWGAAELAANSAIAPAMLADRVASPGGGTRKGLDILDDEDALPELVRLTLDAATRRNREMAAEAKNQRFDSARSIA